MPDGLTLICNQLAFDTLEVLRHERRVLLVRQRTQPTIADVDKDRVKGAERTVEDASN